MSAKWSSIWIGICGYLILAAGIMNVGFDIHHRTEWAVPTDMGLVVGELALIMFGVVTLGIAHCLRQIEKRLDQIEVKQRQSKRATPLDQSLWKPASAEKRERPPTETAE